MTHQEMEIRIKELENQVKALEQQSCDNAINRKDTLKAMIGQLSAEATLYKVVKNMPPVNPQQWETCFDCPLSHGCPKIKGCTNEQAIEYTSEMPNDCPLSAQPERKTDGDTISRQAAIDIVDSYSESQSNAEDVTQDIISDIVGLPPVNPQPKTGQCKDCKYFEYDSVAKVDEIPLIVAHEICSRWGDGCKTSEDGYCFLFEPQERSNKE